MLTFNDRQRILKDFASFDCDKFARVFPDFKKHIEALETFQNYQYSDKTIALVSLVHRSTLVFWPHEKHGIMSNEKLEYLGDAILNFFIASEAMLLYPSWQEGKLSRLRSALVGTESLEQKARKIGLQQWLFTAKGNISEQSNVLADAFEAITAALYLDAGEEKVRDWLQTIFADDLKLGGDILCVFDVKSRVQQWVQAIIGKPPVYKVIGTEATPEQSQFLVGVFVGDTEIARGVGHNKRTASKMAAEAFAALIDAGKITAEMIEHMDVKE